MRNKLTRISGISALLFVSALTGCGDDGPGNNNPDASTPPQDAATQDAAPMDAGGPVFDKTKKTQVLTTGITMAYVEAGKLDGAETVILVHGYTDSSRSYFPTIQALVDSNTDLHIYALDQRGHGGSSMPSDAACPATPEDCFGMDDMAADMLAFMDAKNIESAHIVGHSMSGLAAQELALANPGRVKSLVLLDTWVNGENEGTIDNFLLPIVEGSWKTNLEMQANFTFPDDAYLLTPKDADPTGAEEFMTTVWVTDVTAEPAFLAEVAPETIEVKLGTWIGALRAQNAFDSRARLEELSVPTLSIWATQDFIWPYDPYQVDLLAALDTAVAACNLEYYFHKTYGKEPLPASGFQETDYGHNVQWGAPEAIAADITAWIDNGEPTTDLPYANPANLQMTQIDQGAAVILEKRREASCQ